MTKSKRNPSTSRRDTQRTSKTNKTSINSKKRNINGSGEEVVVKIQKKRIRNSVDSENSIKLVKDIEEEKELVQSNNSSNNTEQEPVYNFKQNDFVQLSPELASRLLHPNPVCFLTTLSSGNESAECNTSAKIPNASELNN